MSAVVRADRPTKFYGSARGIVDTSFEIAAIAAGGVSGSVLAFRRRDLA